MKFVLKVIHVYWFSLSFDPKDTTERIRNFYYNFMWNFGEDKKIFHWVAWSKITLPKELGG